MKAKNMLWRAQLAAVTVLLSQIAIPFTPVPLNLAMVGVLLSGGLLGAKGGIESQLIFLLLGAIGLPVFAGWQGGISALIGPTGGFLLGYPLAAGLVGSWKRSGFWNLVLAMVGGTVVCYVCGTLWFAWFTHTDLWSALWLCVFPFLVGDIGKVFLASWIARRLRHIS